MNNFCICIWKTSKFQNNSSCLQITPGDFNSFDGAFGGILSRRNSHTLTVARHNRTLHTRLPPLPTSNLAIVITQTIFDCINQSITNISRTQPDMPPGDDAVMKTFVFSVSLFGFECWSYCNVCYRHMRVGKAFITSFYLMLCLSQLCIKGEKKYRSSEFIKACFWRRVCLAWIKRHVK